MNLDDDCNDVVDTVAHADDVDDDIGKDIDEEYYYCTVVADTVDGNNGCWSTAYCYCSCN